MASNVYQIVTDRIIAQMEAGIIPWHRPWHGRGGDGTNNAISYVTRKPYSILNQMLIGRPGEYLTFNQIKERGGSIKKGAKSYMVVFFTNAVKTEKTKTSESTDVEEEKKYRYPLLRYYSVFNREDCEGIPSKISPIEAPSTEPSLTPMAEEVINGYLNRETQLQFFNDTPSNSAYYAPAQDKVVVPMPSQFDDCSEYYSTAFHELVHSTGAKHRLDRSTDKPTFFGSEEYSREELVAEMGAAMLCSHCDLETKKSFKNNVALFSHETSLLLKLLIGQTGVLGGELSPLRCVRPSQCFLRPASQNLSPPGPSHFPWPWAGHVPTKQHPPWPRLASFLSSCSSS